MAGVTRQYLVYVDEIRTRNLELAAEIPADGGDADRDQSRACCCRPRGARKARNRKTARRAGRRLLEYEQMKSCRLRPERAAPARSRRVACPGLHRAVAAAALPEVNVVDLQEAWRDIVKRAKLVQHHKITREELSVREHIEHRAAPAAGAQVRGVRAAVDITRGLPV